MIQTSYEKSEFLTEKQKEKEDYLIGMIDSCISEMVYDKDELRKAYNYYNGTRDKDQFMHLEENFGIGNPTSIEFIPLVRRHIDVLIGEHLQNKLKPKVTCKDKKTLNSIYKQKEEEIAKLEMSLIQGQLQNNIDFALKGGQEAGQQVPTDKASEEELSKAKSEAGKNFISQFEIAAQNILTHLVQSKSIDMYHKLKLLFLDLLVAGQCYYKVDLQHVGEVPDVEILNVFDTFIDENPNSPYKKNSSRAVIRYWMNRQQIISKYGHKMDKEAREELDTMAGYTETNDVYYLRNSSGGIVANTGVGFQRPYTQDESQYTTALIPVYETEWLANNEVNMESTGEIGYRMDRYEGVRIGTSIYLNMGKSEHVVRSIEHPSRCTLSVNGISYSDRNGKPYSLVLATAHLQDKYDILHFQRDTYIANSGVKGDWLDTSMLPDYLGTTPQERMLKWMAYGKAGVKLFNSAQEGRGANHNTTFAGFDDTVSGQAIQGFQLAIQQTEDICSSITGVFRERIGGIEQKDAVTNVQVGIKNSAIITKQYFQVMDNITTELLIDSLNMCKISYVDGMVGSIIMGDKMQKVFTVQPEHFSFTDYDVHIADSGEIISDMQKIEAITMELIKGGIVEIDSVLEGIGSESLTEMKENIINSYKKKKEENNQLSQMQQQLEQAKGEMQKMQQELQKAQMQVDQYKQGQLDVQKQQVQYNYEIAKESNMTTEELGKAKIKLEEERNRIEALQLTDGNPNNDEIKNY